jgi:hypothetical protein
LAIAMAALGSVTVTAATPGTAQAACGHVASDFNGDGIGDVVAREPTADEGGLSEVGAVRILYGKSSGVSAAGNQLIDEAALHGLTPPDLHDKFGESSASGYFNSDCYADLAIGIPVKGNNQIATGGTVVIIYGSKNGLDLSTAKVFTETQFLPAGDPELGASLAAGDFNGDGLSDLAMGAPGADIGGGVAIIYGSSTGLTLTGHKFFTQDSSGVPGTGEPFDGFGLSLAAADFNGDGRCDLAVGVPEENIGDIDQAGDVVLMLGSKSGLTGTGATAWSQNTSGVPGTVEDSDEFGTVLAAGDITGDGKADLVIGDQSESVGTALLGGSITVLRGASGGLTATGAQAWSEATAGVPGTEQSNGFFGFALTVADFNGDGHDDVAIGTGNAVGSVSGAGSVVMLRGTSTGLTATGAQYWDQNTSGISGTSETNDLFGEYLQAVNVVSQKYSGLVIGVPDEDTATFTDNGAIEVMRGGATGLTATGSQFFDSQGLVGGAEDNEQMGTGPFV